MASKQAGAPDDGIGKAGFLGGLLAFGSLVALSVVGVGHARTVAGAANLQYWIVAALVASTLGWATFQLSRTPARSPTGDLFRRVGVAAAALWLMVFLWEMVAVGTGAFAGPFELVWAATRA